MSSFLAWARQLVTVMMIILLTTACVLPDLTASLSFQQDHDDDNDNDNDDERSAQAEQQSEALRKGLLSSRQDPAAADAIALGRHRPRRLSGHRLKRDHAVLRPRLFLRLQI